MNRQIVKLFAFIALLFAVLVGFTSYWAVFDAKALKEKEANKRPLLEQQQIRRGRILAADGTVIAKSVAKGRGDGLRYVRRYPQGSLYGHPIGYSFVRQGDSEFEQFHNDELVGEESEFSSILDELLGHSQEGNDVVTNLDPAAQRTALSDLEEAGFGAVVAIEPSTGAVKVMASNKAYDPNRVPYELEKLNRNVIETPLLNRATQGLYPPGSTFKVVTAAAGLESETITPETTIDAPGTLEVEGTPLQNDFNESFGPISLDTALTNSVNTWFGQLGQQLGNDLLFETMEKFGFNSTPPIDLPDDEVYESGVSGEGGLLTARDPVDLARVAIGQGGQEGQVLSTVTQMAEVAATVANGGKLMKPTLIEKVVDPDGRVTDELDPEVQGDVMSEETASELADMMTSVVDEGTAADLAGNLGGTTFAGKTGTAEINIEQDIAQPWFIAFAPVEDPKIAVAVTTDPCAGCFGGTDAGPIATAVMNEILNGG